MVNIKKVITIIIYVLMGILLCLAMFFSVYRSMVSDTDSLVDYVKSIFLGKVSSREIAGTWFDNFDIRSGRYDMEQIQVDIEIKRVFVWHDFNEGFMWVEIDCEARNLDGRVKFGTHNYERWDIKKTDGKWDITRIKENTGGRLFEKF